MKNVIGHPARGKNFYPRESEIHKIGRSLKAGNHIQIAAPRRVGKTSILMYFLDNKQDGEYYFIYVDVEATDSEGDFYKKLYESILKSETLTKSGKLFNQLKTRSNIFLKRIKGVNLLEGGMELNHDVEIDYYTELSFLIKGLDLRRRKIILMIDEFPYAINNLIEGDNFLKAMELLKSKRTLRQDPEINKRVQFIYTGSISLNTTVENINASELVNDIDSIKVSELSRGKARDFINSLLKEDNIELSENHLVKIIDKIGWLIPFHIQLFVKELVSLIDDGHKEMTDEVIDKAFQEIIDFRNNYFEHYLSRLKKLFKGNHYKFTFEVLDVACKKDHISKIEIYNLSSKYSIEAESRRIMHSLIYDGYLYKDEDRYYFNSPILKSWWKSYVL